MNKATVHTASAPAAIGPYSQAVTAGGFIFCSGQIALDPGSGELVGETAADQAKQVLDNLRAVLQAAGADLADVVRTTIYLASMDDFVAVNEVYADYFGDWKPARATVAVKTLPKNGLVEIDCVAVTPAKA